MKTLLEQVHATGIHFDDPSGNPLRDWMGIDRETFYDPQQNSYFAYGILLSG